MSASATTMLWLLAFAAGVNATVGIWSWSRRRNMHGAFAFAVHNFIQASWHVGHFVETLATTRAGKLLWDSLENVPATLIGPAALWVAADYLQIRSTPRQRGLIGVLALLMAAPLASEPLHHLFRGAAVLEGTPAVLTYPFGGLDIAEAFLIYAGTIAAAVLLVRGLGLIPREYMLQRIALALALIAPVITTMIVMTLNVRIDGDRDISPISTTLGALLGAWGLARYGLFDLAPVARDAVIAALPEGVYVIDLTGRVTDMNAAATGLTPGAVGASYRTLFARWQAVIALLDQQRTQACDVGEPPDASGRCFEASCTRLDDSHGHANGFSLVLRDITLHRQRFERLTHHVSRRTEELQLTRASLARASAERSQIASALAVSEERFRTLFDQVFQLTGLLDREGRLLAANRAALRMIGVQEGDVIGLPFWQTPWWSHSQPAQQALREGIERCAQGEFVRFQAQHRDASGKTRHIDFSLTPVRDATGVVVEMIPEGRDVTALHEERERADLLAAQLQSAQRLDAMGRLAGGLAHDFNNLLTVIGCSAELASMLAASSPETLECLGSIKDATNSAAEITRGLLAFGRQQPILHGRAEPEHVIHGTEKLLRRLIRENIAVSIDVDTAIWPAHTDSTPLQQVIMNLLLNAQDAMPEGGALALRAGNVVLDASAAAEVGGYAGEFVRVAVIDNGVGMSKEVLARAFEPFFSTKAVGKGTGLGLAIVHGIVTQCCGFIDVRSAPGAGTTVAVYFPRAQPAESKRPLSDAHTSSVRRHTRIWIVDDQVPVLRTLQRVLEADGHDVRAFAGPSEALAAADSGRDMPALLITDIVMPSMNGIELARAVAERMPQLRLILMSGYAENAELDLLSSFPADRFLAKPFAPAALLAAVHAALADSPVLFTASARHHQVRSGSSPPPA